MLKQLAFYILSKESTGNRGNNAFKKGNFPGRLGMIFKMARPRLPENEVRDKVPLRLPRWMINRLKEEGGMLSKVIEEIIQNHIDTKDGKAGKIPKKNKESKKGL
ncbi:hypothetical protein [Brevibacillus laterosporus]|uniref:hypothetical protein n=1 Tax=Brevibacillus laterosporus TaxID=1465 RepID=UPI003D1BD2CD